MQATEGDGEIPLATSHADVRDVGRLEVGESGGRIHRKGSEHADQMEKVNFQILSGR